MDGQTDRRTTCRSNIVLCVASRGNDLEEKQLQEVTGSRLTLAKQQTTTGSQQS